MSVFPNFPKDTQSEDTGLQNPHLSVFAKALKRADVGFYLYNIVLKI